MAGRGPIPAPRATVARVGAWAERAAEAWLGFAFPPAARAIDEAAFEPEAPGLACVRCGRGVEGTETTKAGCGACRRVTPAGRLRGGIPWIDRVVRLGPYAPPLETWITGIKYHRWPEMGDALGRLLGRAVLRARAVRPSRAVVVPVPMPRMRRWHRGIDHARVIADGVGATLRAPVETCLKKSHGPPQVALSGSARKRGRGGDWITLRRRIGGLDLSGLEVVLVDDVLTTGTTLRAAARHLREANASRVVAAVLAVTEERERGAKKAVDDVEPERPRPDQPPSDQPAG